MENVSFVTMRLGFLRRVVVIIDMLWLHYYIFGAGLVFCFGESIRNKGFTFLFSLFEISVCFSRVTE